MQEARHARDVADSVQMVLAAAGSVESRGGATTCRAGGADSSPPLSEPTSPSGPSSVSTLPLVEPDGRFSRIRLSDKVSCVRPWTAVGEGFQPNQAQRSVEILVGEPRDSTPLHLVVCDTATSGADTGCGHPPPGTLCSPARDGSR